MDINGARVMVVGGASGMARATAERLAAGGAKVAILDRPGTEGANVAAAIGGYFFECDITDFDGTTATVAAAIEALGGLDVGVNVAGGGIGKKTLDKHGAAHDLESFRQVVDLVGLSAAFGLLAAALLLAGLATSIRRSTS